MSDERPQLENTFQPVPEGHKMFLWRQHEEREIDAAVDAVDVVRIEELCVAALEDPFLPPYFRAKYEIYLAIVPGRNMENHLSSAEIMIERMKELMADGTGSRWMQENIVSMEAYLRETRREAIGLP